MNRISCIIVREKNKNNHKRTEIKKGKDMTNEQTYNFHITSYNYWQNGKNYNHFILSYTIIYILTSNYLIQLFNHAANKN